MRHVPPAAVYGGLATRLASLFLGLFACATGIVLLLQADLGLPPWDVLHQGIAERTPLSFGAANIVVGLLVVALAWRLGARIGFATVANATCVGALVQLLLSVEAIPDLSSGNLGERTAFVAAGVICFGIGTAFYIGAAMGAGPRDSLMLVVAHRKGVRVGLSRAAIELSVLVAGYALGGSVGVGTLAFAILVGPSVELAFFVLGRSPLASPAPELLGEVS